MMKTNANKKFEGCFKMGVPNRVVNRGWGLSKLVVIFCLFTTLSVVAAVVVDPAVFSGAGNVIDPSGSETVDETFGTAQATLEARTNLRVLQDFSGFTSSNTNGGQATNVVKFTDEAVPSIQFVFANSASSAGGVANDISGATSGSSMIRLRNADPGTNTSTLIITFGSWSGTVFNADRTVKAAGFCLAHIYNSKSGTVTFRDAAGTAISSAVFSYVGQNDIDGLGSHKDFYFGWDSVAQSSVEIGSITISFVDSSSEYSSGFDDLAFTIADMEAPSPNPMTWASPPFPLGFSRVVMTATTVTDPSRPVTYFFTNTVNGYTSGWINQTTWTNTGLIKGSTYAYQVRARDADGNTGDWSSEQAVVLPAATIVKLIDYAPALRDGGFESGAITNSPWGIGLGVTSSVIGSGDGREGSWQFNMKTDVGRGAVQNTSFVVERRDRFDLSFDWASQGNWDSADSIVWRLVTTSDDAASGVVSVIASGSVSGKTGTATWTTEHVLIDGGTVEVASLGRQLWVQFVSGPNADSGTSEFAGIDKVRLTVNRAKGGTVISFR